MSSTQRVALVCKEHIYQCRRHETQGGVMPGWGRSLEEGMATHSSLLAWRIPWTGAWRAIAVGSQSWMLLKQFSTHTPLIGEYFLF